MEKRRQQLKHKMLQTLSRDGDTQQQTKIPKMKDYKEETKYWYNQVELHGRGENIADFDDVGNYGPDYYVAKILTKIIPKFLIIVLVINSDISHLLPLRIM